MGTQTSPQTYQLQDQNTGKTPKLSKMHQMWKRGRSQGGRGVCPNRGSMDVPAGARILELGLMRCT